MRARPLMLRSPSVLWTARGLVLLLLLLLGWALGTTLRAGHAADWPARTGRIRVLTTIFPLYDFAREIGGPHVELRSLLPPGVDVHEFALSPRDMALVDGADVILINGAGLDAFVADALERAQATAVRPVDVSEGLPRLSGVEAEAHGDHPHEEGDPHLWLDPVNARRYADRIGAALVAALEQRGAAEAAARVRARAASYDAALARLDREYRSALAGLSDRSFIAFHGAFAYLAARYNLTIAAVWQSTPGREPSPREVGALLRLAKARGIRALFSEPQFSPRALERIAADADIPVYTLNPLETAADFERTRYLDVMRRNLSTLVRALGR